MGTTRRSSRFSRTMADDEEQEERKTGFAAEGNTDKVTDFHEEKEMDASAAADSLAEIQKVEQAAADEAKAIASKLAAVKVEKADIETVAHEMALSKEDAEKALRQNEGDLKATLVALCRA